MRPRPSVTLGLCLLLVAGCGGGDSGDGEKGEASGKAEVVRSADRICATAARKSQRALKQLAKSAGGIGRINVNSTALGVMLQGDVLYMSQALQEHRKLKPPDDGRAVFERFVDGETRLLAVLRDAEAAVAQGPAALQQTGPRLEAAGTETSRAAGRYGLSECPPVGSFVEFIQRATEARRGE